MTGSKSKLIEQPLPEDDPTRRKPDITLARKKLDWEPTVSFEQMVRMMVDADIERLRVKS